jgi:uncharacterized protein YbjT (DUF2867 family)
VLTRDASKGKNLRRRHRRRRQPAGARLGPPVFDGVDAVFLLNAVGQTEANEGLMSVSAMRAAGVKRVVYISVHHVEKAAWLPHLAPKVGVEVAIQNSGIPYTILRPTISTRTTTGLRTYVACGLYPQPIGDVGLSRVDVRDIAEAAVVALHEEATRRRRATSSVPSAHRRGYRGRWGRALGKPIKYAGNDLEAWEAQSLAYMPDWLVMTSN